jgi:hypothetical protein
MPIDHAEDLSRRASPADAAKTGAWGRLSACWSRTDSDKSEGAPPMRQIADWLEKLGMSEYAERFTDSDIDTSALPDLTDQDLKELGVSVGHWRKMLRAVAELAGPKCRSLR